MSIINGKKFDTSFVCNRFNNNNELLLEEIAEEFGISRDELVDRLKKGAGRDEKDRVKGIIRQDEKRQKRCTNTAKQQNKPETVQKEATMPKSKTTLETERTKLMEQIAQHEQKFQQSTKKVDELKAVANASELSVSKFTAKTVQLESQIEELKKRLEKARASLNDVITMLREASRKHGQNQLALEEARQQAQKNEEHLNFLKLELEELDNRRVYLVAPTYDITKLPDVVGRIISSAKLDGVEYEKVETDMYQISFGNAVHLLQETGFEQILELGMAYEFAWLVAEYMGNPNYEVHVLNEDERIQKLIDWLMS